MTGSATAPRPPRPSACSGPAPATTGRDDRALAAALRARGAQVDLDADGLDVVGLPANDIGLIAFEAGIVLHELHTRGSELEDAFLTRTAEGGIA